MQYIGVRIGSIGIKQRIIYTEPSFWIFNITNLLTIPYIGLIKRLRYYAVIAYLNILYLNDILIIYSVNA
jgi:hypothetical protein